MFPRTPCNSIPVQTQHDSVHHRLKCNHILIRKNCPDRPSKLLSHLFKLRPNSWTINDWLSLRGSSAPPLPHVHGFLLHAWVSRFQRSSDGRLTCFPLCTLVFGWRCWFTELPTQRLTQDWNWSQLDSFHQNTFAFTAIALCRHNSSFLPFGGEHVPTRTRIGVHVRRANGPGKYVCYNSGWLSPHLQKFLSGVIHIFWSVYFFSTSTRILRHVLIRDARPGVGGKGDSSFIKIREESCSLGRGGGQRAILLFW